MALCSVFCLWLLISIRIQGKHFETFWVVNSFYVLINRVSSSRANTGTSPLKSHHVGSVEGLGVDEGRRCPGHSPPMTSVAVTGSHMPSTSPKPLYWHLYSKLHQLGRLGPRPNQHAHTKCSYFVNQWLLSCLLYKKKNKEKLQSSL